MKASGGFVNTGAFKHSRLNKKRSIGKQAVVNLLELGDGWTACQRHLTTVVFQDAGRPSRNSHQ